MKRNDENIKKSADFLNNEKEPIVKKRAIKIEKIDLKNIILRTDSPLNSKNSESAINYNENSISKIISSERTNSVGNSVYLKY